MIDDLIIIIPTHNRQHYLGRVIRYYSSFPCKVYICDSSKQKAEVETPENINYRWVPQSNFYGKVLDVLNETFSDFYALSPDDDFLKQETLMECYDAMKKDDALSVGVGKQLFYNYPFKGEFYFIPSANGLSFIKGVVVNSNEDYCLMFWQNYQNILWSVFRREVIYKSFNELEKCNFQNGNFVEILLSIEGLRNGHFYVSSSGLNYREEIVGEHWGNMTPPICMETIGSVPELKKDVECFNLFFAEDDFALHNFGLYLSAQPPLNIKQKPFRSFLKKITPPGIRHAYAKLLGKKPLYEDVKMSEILSQVIA